MHGTLRWAAPAALLIGVLGCGQDAASTKSTPAEAEANRVTLKVDGMT